LTEFTADASHELRTPVAFIRTRTDVLLRHSRSDQEWREGVVDIQAASVQMSELVDGLLELARADAGARHDAFEPVDVERVVSDAMRHIAPLAAAKKLRLIAATDPVAGTVEGDPKLLER